MKHKYTNIQTNEGKTVRAHCPVIISASRATDIPAFYGDWLMNRLREGYVKRLNPFNGKPYYISFKHTRAVIFWTKNVRPFFQYINDIKALNLNYYFQYTLTGYGPELEPNVPPLPERVDTFIELSERIGPEKMIWRFDPYILMHEQTSEDLLEITDKIAQRLKNHTGKMVFSFADISRYQKVKRNMKGINYREFSEKEMHLLAEGLQKMNKNWGLQLAACAEQVDLSGYGIDRNKCIDDELLLKLFPNDIKLCEFLGVKTDLDIDSTQYKTLKDPGQRADCGCIQSKDIGQYNTCPHGCRYCYANASMQTAMENFNKHGKNTGKESII